MVHLLPGHNFPYKMLLPSQHTTHKTQSISLSSVSITLDSEIFSPGQAYVALSRCTSWENLQIISFDKNAIITDQSMIQEYNRLKEKISIPLPL